MLNRRTYQELGEAPRGPARTYRVVTLAATLNFTSDNTGDTTCYEGRANGIRNLLLAIIWIAGQLGMDAGHETVVADSKAKPLHSQLYFQVLAAIFLGVSLGHFYPAAGEATKSFGDGFIKLIKMVIAPIIFVTVVHGIASIRDLKKVGRVGVKAIIYFEVLTSLALVIGL
ncbi:MAG TPA: cation:dicarboxylase symporter family transporter, partial [Hyphomicrobium sp.]